jgi:hypothetical protein
VRAEGYGIKHCASFCQTLDQFVVNPLQVIKLDQASSHAGLIAANGNAPTVAFEIRNRIKRPWQRFEFLCSLDEIGRIKVYDAVPVENYESSHPDRGR